MPSNWLLAVIVATLAAAPAAVAQDEAVPPAGERSPIRAADRRAIRWLDRSHRARALTRIDTLENGRLDDRLDLKLDWMEVSCGINPAQRKKLKLAGRRDIKRFLDELREMKREYRQVKSDPIQFGKMQTSACRDPDLRGRGSLRRRLRSCQR